MNSFGLHRNKCSQEGNGTLESSIHWKMESLVCVSKNTALFLDGADGSSLASSVYLSAIYRHWYLDKRESRESTFASLWMN